MPDFWIDDTAFDDTSFDLQGSDWATDLASSATYMSANMSGSVFSTDNNYSYIQVGAVDQNGTFQVNLDFVAGAGLSNCDVRVRLHRANSSGTTQASGTYTSAQTASSSGNTFSGTETGLGTFASGDYLILEIEVVKTGGAGSQTYVLDSGSYQTLSTAMDQEVDPTGIASTLAFGTLQANLEVSPTGIASALAFGTTTVAPDQDVSPTGIASTSAFGTAEILPGERYYIHDSSGGIANGWDGTDANIDARLLSATPPSTGNVSEIIQVPGLSSVLNRTFTPLNYPGVNGVSKGIASITLVFGTGTVTTGPSGDQSLNTVSITIQRTNSVGTVQASATSGARPQQPPWGGGTQEHYVELDGLGTWSAGDRLQVGILLGCPSGGKSYEAEIGIGSAGTLVHVPWVPAQGIDPAGISSTAFGTPQLNLNVSPAGIVVEDTYVPTNVSSSTLVDGAAAFDMTLRQPRTDPGFASYGSSSTNYQIYPVGAVDQAGLFRAELLTDTIQTSGTGVRVRLQRVNSSGVTQATGTWTGYETTSAGVQTLSFEGTETGLGTFSAGDFLVLAIDTDGAGSLYLDHSGGFLTTGIVGATLGSPTLNLNVSPTGIASTLAFGTLQVNLNVYPSGIASTLAFGTANVGAQYIYPTGIASTSGVGPPQIARLAAMALLHSTLSTSHGCRTAEYKHLGYITNGWDKVLRWDGRSSAIETAGITGPSTEIDSWTVPTVETAGDCTAGLHLIRYRYLDSRTGYPSDPSEEREITVSAGASNGKLTLPIGNALTQVGPDAGTGFDFAATTITRNDAGSWVSGGWKVGDYVTVASANTAGNNGTVGPVTAVTASILTVASAAWSVDTGDNTATFNNVAARRIVPSTDSKVDRIVIEMSPVNDATFYTALEVENTANTVAEVSISDPELEVSFLPYPDVGHLPPPVAKNIVSHRDRIWLFGQVTHTTGNCDVTNGSVDIPAGASDPDWRASALGDTVAGSAEKTVAWFFLRSGDDQVYEIDTYDAGNDKLILKDAAGYQGTTGTDVEYTIFSRANVIWVSEAGFPESFSPLKFLNGPNGERAGDITAGIGYFSSMLFYADSSMIKVAWDQGPLTDPQQFTISTLYGALSSRVVIEVDGVVYAMDKRGWTSWKGVFPQLISRPIDEIRSLIDYDQAEFFHACYFPELRAIRWFVSYTGDTYPRNYVQFDVDTQTWSTGQYYQAIADSRLVPSSEGLRVMYGDDQGHVWLADRDNADGCDVSYSRLAADAGATTTVIPITGATLPTAGSALTGCYLYHLASGEARLITSNTTTEITVGTAFSNPPTTADVLWVGAIPSKLKTKAFRSKNLGKKAKPREVWIEFAPLASTRYLQMRVYDDLSSTAKTWATGTRNDPDGLVFPGNNAQYPTSDWLIDLSESDGHVEVDIGSEFRRTFEIEFEINEPDAPLELVSLEFTGIELEDEQ